MPPNHSINNIYEDDDDDDDDMLLGTSVNSKGGVSQSVTGGSGTEIFFLSFLILGCHGLFLTGKCISAVNTASLIAAFGVRAARQRTVHRGLTTLPFGMWEV